MELVVVPMALLFIGQAIDHALAFPLLFKPAVAKELSAICFGMGIPWLAWSIYWQHAKGGGTPFPLVPTHVLLTDGPYRYCRNPMAFGALCWLGGWACLANGPTSLIGGLGFFATVVLSWDRWVEEKELGLKHGAAYVNYRHRTPFLIPLLRRRSKKAA